MSLDNLGSRNVTVDNPSIEQTTGVVHNNKGIAAAGKDTSGNVQQLLTDTDGQLKTFSGNIDRQLQERNYIENIQTRIYNMLALESHTSQAIGFEIR